MSIEATPELAADAALVLAAIRPALEARGVTEIRIVVRGKPGRAEYFVGYRFGAGAERSASQIREDASAYWPAAVRYQSLFAVKIENLPVVEPELVAAQAKIRGPWWRLWPVYVLALGVGAFFVSQIAFGRGDLVASAGLRAAGSASTTFESKGEPLSLWADLDGYFTGSAGSETLDDILPVHYEVDFVQGGTVVRHVSVDTQVRRTVQKKYCTVAPTCEVFLQELSPFPPGPVEMRVTATPAPNVTRVSNLSLGVRESGFF